MEIATGYFARAKNYADDGYVLVSIAKVTPWFFSKDLKLHSLPALAPTEDILSLRDRPAEYEKRYKNEILSHLSRMEVYQELSRLAQESAADKVVLLCYESSEKFCHRHIVAKWIEDGLGKVVSEVPQKQAAVQSLFESDV